MAHIVQILNRLAWPELFSLFLIRVSHLWWGGGAFFWPIAFSRLCCDTQTRMRLHRGALEVSLRLKDLSLKMHINIRTTNSASVYAATPNQQAELLRSCRIKFWSLSFQRLKWSTRFYFRKGSWRKCTRIFVNICENVDQESKQGLPIFCDYLFVFEKLT